MSSHADFLIGLLDVDDPVCLDWEDVTGPHAQAVRLWRRMGFVSRDPGHNPSPSCPACGEGMPYSVGGAWRCNRCRCAVDERYLRLWAVDVPAVLGWFAVRLGLRGEARVATGRLWQLGTDTTGHHARAYFYLRGEANTDVRRALAGYQDVTVLHGPLRPRLGSGVRAIALAPLLQVGSSMRLDAAAVLRSGLSVRFDTATGALRAGGRLFGEVPVGSKEYHFVRCLAARPDQFVPYADIKRFVRAASGSRDGTDEATFCQMRKSRIKRRWVPEIDRLVETTHKGDGYRLRGQLLVAELMTSYGHWVQQKSDWLHAKFAWCTAVDWSCVTPQLVGG
mgnify:CR=1 FL=1